MKITTLILAAICLFSCTNNQKANNKSVSNIPNNEFIQTKINSEDSIKKNLTGTWISNDDKKSKLIFTREFLLDFYNDKIIDTLDYEINIKGKESFLKTTDAKANIEFYYSIDYLTQKELSLIYLESGNTLNYSKH